MKASAIHFSAALAFAAMLGPCGAADAPAQAPAPQPVRLNNDAKYKDALDALIKAPPAPTATPQARIIYIHNLTVAELRMRDYNKAVTDAQQLVKLTPAWSAGHDDLSVCLGKAGKYEDAIAEAKQALSLENPPTAHSTLLLATWEWLAGKKNEALKRVAGVAAPTDPVKQRDYYGSLAGFYAAAGDEEKLQDAIQKASAVDKQGSMLDFMARDIVFDPYREKEWFVKLAGKTLAEPAAGK